MSTTPLAPMTALIAAAAATRRLRIGTLVLDNDYRHPAILAKEAATLDLLSDGRLELGLGAGWLRREYELAGIPFDPPGVRVTRLEEGLTVLKRGAAAGHRFLDQPHCGSGSWGGWCPSLADYVTGMEPTGGAIAAGRVLELATL